MVFAEEKLENFKLGKSKASQFTTKVYSSAVHSVFLYSLLILPSLNKY